MNGRLIAKRRLQLGISRTDLAHLTGLSWDLIATLEERGEPPALTLHAARRLAAALGIDLASVAATWGRGDPTPDDVRLEALLAHADHPISRTHMAQALNLSLEDAQRALDQLEVRLAETGLTIRHVTPGCYALAGRGNVLQPGDVSRLRQQEQPISAHDAALLRRVIVGGREDRNWDNFDHAQRMGLARLAERGLIQSDGTWIHSTDDADYNLQPELQQTGPHGVQWPLRDRRAAGAQ